MDGHASYPEGPLFAGNTLYVAEMGADRVSAYENGQKSTFFKSAGCGPTALAPYRNGFLILCHIGGELVAVDKAGKEIQRFGKGVLRDPNDGYADPMGGVYFSDPGLFSKDTRPEGFVYRLTPEGKLDRVESGLWYPNGVYVDNAEKAVYVSETFARKVWRYAMGADGKLSGKTLFADIDVIDPKTKFSYREAGPDGLERDPATGEMIVAIYGEGHLLRIDRAGKLVGQIKTPSQYETNIAFGAPGAVVVGAYDNANPPLPGEVRWWKRAR
ncbi:MAG TPA: SMP-30/gluconolactonase/LRE family protein [Caulobacterales bacterium]|nr:SMP-30/gluconolactonase/LRE family protein [Caulobacterales bacterium]